MGQRSTVVDVDGKLAAQLVAEQTPFDLTVSMQFAQRLKAAVDALPPTQRAVVTLHLRDGMTFAAIAAQIGVSDSMVKKHVYTALASCRKRLRDMKP